MASGSLVRRSCLRYRKHGASVIVPLHDALFTAYQRSGLTYAQISMTAHCHENTVSRAMSGRPISSTTLTRIAHAVGLVVELRPAA